MKKTRVKIVAVRKEADTPCWPCINHEAEKELQRIITPVVESNPDMDFDVVFYTHLQQAEADYAADVEIYDGVLVLLMTCWKGIDTFYAAQSKEGIPTIIADVPLCGSGSTLANASPFIREHKLPVPLLSTFNYAEIAEAVRLFDVLAKMKQTSVLVISNSPAVQSSCDQYAQEWGCSFIRKTCDDFMPYFRAVSEEAAQQVADKWIRDAVEVREASDAEIVESARVHLALRQMMQDTETQAVTVDCLALSYQGAYGKNHHFYPCLSHFEMLNNGTVAVCEADISSTVTSLAIYYLTGRQGYVSDPVIDTSSNQIIYAHCVACKKSYGCSDPRSCRYAIRSHAEDQKGASVQVYFPSGDALTTLMIYPKDMPSVIHSAKAVGNMGLTEACRSKLVGETNARNVLNNWSGGWHRVTVFGDYSESLKLLMKMKGLSVIDEDK